MEVAFTLTPDDILSFARYYYRSRTMKVRPVFFYALLCLEVVVLLGGLWVAQDVWRRTGHVLWAVLIGSVIMALGSCLLLPPTRGRAVKLTRKHPEVMMQKIVTISPEWLAGKTPLSESKHSWQTLHSIEEAPDYIYLFISKAAAHIIPKRAFSSRAEAQTFLDRSRQCWEAARTGQAVPAEDADVWPPPPRSVSGH